MNNQNAAGHIPESVSAGQGGVWLTESFRLWLKDWLPWTVVALVIIGSSLVLNVIPFGGLVSNLLFPAILGGLMLVCHESSTGTPDFADSFARGFTRNLTQSLVLGAIYLGGIFIILIIVIIFLALSLGGIAVIQGLLSGNTEILTPAIVIHVLLAVLIALLTYVPLLMAVWFAPALVVLENRQVVPAMIASFHACLANVIPFLVYGLIGLVLCILATIPLALGWLILIPVLIMSVYTSYRDIFQKNHEGGYQVKPS